MKAQIPLITLDQAKKLVELLEQGLQHEANALLADVCQPNAHQMFTELGHLTRQLHTSLNEFQLDPRLPDLAEKDIPDARERLNYVIDMTDKAANKTMDAVDACMPLSDRLNDNIQKILPDWNALMTRNIAVGNFKILCHQIDDFLKVSESDTTQLRHLLTDILMAQDFQDLTGQMIRKVIALVQEVETKLVEMLTMFGDLDITAGTTSQIQQPERNIEAEGPIINKELRTDVVNDQYDVDDLLSSLGF
jgi:chemotaxis protein CheZ